MKKIFFAASIMLGLGLVLQVYAVQAQTSRTDSVGIEGRISTPPPTVGAAISFPSNGQTFRDLPVAVTGICTGDVLVKLFKNGIFTGSAQCTGGNFTITIDLFSGSNELIAKVYDALDQAGPDSAAVTVTYEEAGFVTGSRVTLTSNYAKRGANPGEPLTWPIALSGGSGPYAISVDWGDGAKADLISREFPGAFDLKHVYDSAGVYNIVIKATDTNGIAAFLQVVGVANGPVSQEEAAASKDDAVTITKIVWWPLASVVPLLLAAFWLGKRYELHILQDRARRN